MRDIVQNNWPVIFKHVEVIKVKEKSKNHFGVKEASRDRNMTTKYNT